MDFKQISVFEDKTLESLLKDIYEKSQKKSTEFDAVITKLIGMLESARDASVIMPLLAEYSKLSISNDDQLIKLAAIVQKFHSKIKSKSTSNDDLIPYITDAEREALMRDINSLQKVQMETIEFIDVNKDI